MAKYLEGFHPAIRQKSQILEVSYNIFETSEACTFSLEAIVFGGSYANGKFTDGQDIDADFLYNGGNIIDFIQIIQATACTMFLEQNIDLHVRAHITRNGQAITLSKQNPFHSHMERGAISNPSRITSTHPNSPFVALNSQAINFWNLIT